MHPFINPGLIGGGVIPAPLVANVFDIQTRTGTGAAASIVTSFAPDAYFSKGRSGATAWAAYDTARGVQNDLGFNLTTAETVQAQGVTAFNVDGVSIGTLAKINTSAATYVDFLFKKAPRFFDIVTWTGNGANRTIPHALGVAPGMIRVKRRDDTGAWRIWHKDLTSAAYGITMGDPEASEPTLWNSTAPGASVFSLGTHDDVNANGATYVAHLYAHDTSPNGIIQCGIFTLNGSGAATVSGLPFQSQYGVFAYRSVTPPYWTAADTTRGWGVGSDPYVFEYDAAAEGSADFGAPTSDGFTIINFSAGQACLYMAIKA